MGRCCGDRRAAGLGGLTMCIGMWMADKVKGSVQCDNGASVCFPTVSLPPSLFLFAAQHLSAFHPLFSLCLLSSLICLSLSVCFPPLFSLCLSEKEVAALQRWV